MTKMIRLKTNSETRKWACRHSGSLSNMIIRKIAVPKDQASALRRSGLDAQRRVVKYEHQKSHGAERPGFGSLKEAKRMNMELIRARHSVRTFDGQSLKESDRLLLENYLSQLANPFHIPPQFVKHKR